jgi:serine/threonine-protein kinase/endoribonuclease IRE1
MLEQKIFMFDRHEILGEGGHGLVYKGMWHGIPVAVKRKLQLNNFTNEREERALLKLNHPNVIKLFHADGDQDFKYRYQLPYERNISEIFVMFV